MKALQNAVQRRASIWLLLCERRQDTISNLASELNVSTRTIYNDICILSLTHPLEYIRRYHEGGVKLPDWLQPHNNITKDQFEVLCKAQSLLKGIDAAVMTDYINQIILKN